jgi:hypothetical protein
MNSADVADDATERTRKSFDDSREFMAGSPRRWNRARPGIVGLLAFAGRIRR